MKRFCRSCQCKFGVPLPLTPYLTRHYRIDRYTALPATTPVDTARSPVTAISTKASFPLPISRATNLYQPKRQATLDSNAITSASSSGDKNHYISNQTVQRDPSLPGALESFQDLHIKGSEPRIFPGVVSKATEAVRRGSVAAQGKRNSASEDDDGVDGERDGGLVMRRREEKGE